MSQSGKFGTGEGGLAPVSDLNAYQQAVVYSNLSVREASLNSRSIWGGFGAVRWYLASI